MNISLAETVRVDISPVTHSEDGWSTSSVYEAYADHVRDCSHVPCDPLPWDEWRALESIVFRSPNAAYLAATKKEGK